MNAFELADKLQNAASSHYGELCGALWDGGAMLRNLHTENMALRCTEMALRDRVAELEQQLAARVPDGWKLVPVEPTSEMLYLVGKQGEVMADMAAGYRKEIWAAMLAATPQPVAQPEQPAMAPIGKRKLDSLIADGYSVCGVMIERANEDGTQVTRGAVSVGGLVLWWHPEQPATGHDEADRIVARLLSSDPDFNDCNDAAALIQREIKGPDGFATWRDAAIAERIKRVAAEQPAVQGEPVAWSVLDKRTGKHWYTNESKSTAQYYANHYSHRESDGTNSMVVTPLYANPQPSENPSTPERVALTIQQYNALPCLQGIPPSQFETVVRGIEAAHGIKGEKQ